MRRVDLHAVKACCRGPDSGVNKLPDDQMDLLFGHIVRLCLQIPAVGLQVPRAQRQLRYGGTASGMNGIRQPPMKA